MKIIFGNVSAKIKGTAIINGQSLTKNILYRANIQSDKENKFYIGFNWNAIEKQIL